MQKHPPALAMSQIIASDAPLLSPLSDSPWDSPTNDSFNYSYYNLPPSPPISIRSTNDNSPLHSARILKARIPTHSASDLEQLCLPTHQVFDFPQVPSPPTPSSLSVSMSPQLRPSISIESSASSKRSASPAPSISKKPRSVGERISSKDFIPPDVSGLSKREARLVKNRAAAFLSRQRKREEFELMEVRVVELEQENARLLSLAQSNGSASAPQEFMSEVDQLRAELAAAKARERELSAELAAKAAEHDASVKVEALEPSFPLSTPPRSSAVSSPHKSAASLGLMVLLCALPTLLSMPTQSTLPTSFALPTPLQTSSSTFDYNSFLPNDYDWSRTNSIPTMEIDSDDRDRLTTAAATSATKKLEFSAADSEALGGLGGLDISFDASPSDSGKIRVRIHPSSSTPSRDASPGLPYNTKSPGGLSSSSSSLGMWAGSESNAQSQMPFPSSSYGSSSATPYTSSSASSGDPFFGIGASTDYSMPYQMETSSMMYGQMGGDLLSSTSYSQLSGSDYSYGSEYGAMDSNADGTKRRVRIALKSMPAAGGEGGEWEVHFC